MLVEVTLYIAFVLTVRISSMLVGVTLCIAFVHKVMIDDVIKQRSCQCNVAWCAVRYHSLHNFLRRFSTRKLPSVS